jgi:hypothetical protein
LLEWLTPDFDGVILFDEAHAMGGVAGGEGRFDQLTTASIAAMESRPAARPPYASATGHPT